jgi:hypothetical protein
MGDRPSSDHWFGQANQDRTSAVELRDDVAESSRYDEGLEALAARDISERTGPHATVRRGIERGHLIQRGGDAEVAEHHRERGRSAIRVRLLSYERDVRDNLPGFVAPGPFKPLG